LNEQTASKLRNTFKEACDDIRRRLEEALADKPDNPPTTDITYNKP
jgi:hypothetical protein